MCSDETPGSGNDLGFLLEKEISFLSCIFCVIDSAAFFRYNRQEYIRRKET